MPLLKEKYINTGKLYFEFRDYPLYYHPGSRIAASFANCAAQQGQFWALHDRIVIGFADNEWVEGNVGDQRLFAEYASKLPHDSAQLEVCRTNTSSFEMALKTDMQSAEAFGIRGTPMFVLNGQVLFGSYSYSTWQHLFDERLGQLTPEQQPSGPSRQLIFILLGAGFIVIAIAGGVGMLTYWIVNRRQP